MESSNRNARHRETLATSASSTSSNAAVGSVSGDKQRHLDIGGDDEEPEPQNNDSQEEVNLLPTSNDTGTKIYLQRYWILFIYSSVLFFQSVVWNTWGPISDSALYAFPNWKENTIATLSNTTCIGLIVAVFPICTAVQRWGVRPVTLTLMAASVLGLSLLCTVRDPALFTKAAYVNGLLNGGLACIVLAAPLVSVVWFPSTQRLTATAVSSIMAQVGVGASFLFPYFVRAPSSKASPAEVAHDIQMIMVFEFFTAVGLFVGTLTYFPSAPSLPPSTSAGVPRLSLAAGFRAVALIGNYWLLMISFGIFTGVSGCWISVIAFSLKQFDFTQNDVAVLGVCVAVSMAVVSVVSAYLADKFYGRLKLTLLLIMLCSSVSYVYFLLMSVGLSAASKALVFVVVIAGQSSNAASTPFFLELCCEISHPVPESITGTLALFLSSAVGAVFLLLFSAPQIAVKGPAWIAYILVASNLATILPVALVKEVYSRSEIDRRPPNSD